MKDVLLIPDRRSRQAQATRNRLLEQTMKYLATVQRRAMSQKTDDIDALIVAITRLATPITQVVRLHHQLWQVEAEPDVTLASVLRMLGLDEPGAAKEEAS